MKKWLKNKKGLTLVELLAVIVILGVVAAIAVPTIGKTISNSKDKADVGTYNMIVDAATRWSLDQQADGASGATTASTDIQTELVDKGYLTNFKSTMQSNSNFKFDKFEVTISTGGSVAVIVHDGTKTITSDGKKLTESGT